MKNWQPKDLLPVTVVSDPGLDDLLALALLGKLLPGAPRQIVATFGNMPADVTAQNAQDFVCLTDVSWSWRRGAARPLGAAGNESWIDGKQGKNGLWDIRPDGALPVPESKAAAAGRVIALATLTDVKKLLEAGGIKELLIMGGVFDRFQENGNPAELNIRFDVAAAQWVFANLGQVRTRLVPAEVAFDVSWSRDLVGTIPETTPLNCWLKRLLLAGYDNGRYVTGNELYDPLAVFLAFYPECALWRWSGIAVLPDGRTRLRKDGPSCLVATRVRDPEAVAMRIFELLFLEDEL